MTNTGTTPVPYGEITLRYWLTVEDFAPLTNLSVYWAQLGTNKVKMKYVELGSPRQGALGYVEYSFDASAGSLAPGTNSGPIQSGIGKQNWTNFNESDDYSYANKSSFQPNSRITIYRNGLLVGGQEPATTAVVEQLKVYTQTNAGTPTNTLSTYLQLRNEGNRPVSFGEVSLRYYFTADGSQPLNFYLDYAWLGNANVQARFVKLSPPLANADTYLELRFPAGLGQLYPLSGTGNIQYRIAKSDWSPFSQSNDHSYLASSSFAENNRVVVYVGTQRVYGQEPGAGARQGAEVTDASLRVVVLGNPVRGPELDVEIDGASGEPVGLELRDGQGQVVSQKQVLAGEATGRHRLSVAGQPAGLLLLRVSTPTQVKVIKIIKAE